MSRHHLIEDYLNELRVLPAEMVDELADGLTETYDHYRARGQAADDAARAAITEFGTAEQIVAAFDRITPGRRASRTLLATGPLAGLCWGPALLSARVWTWPGPAWALPLLGAALLMIIAVLMVAALGRRMSTRHSSARAVSYSSTPSPSPASSPPPRRHHGHCGSRSRPPSSAHRSPCGRCRASSRADPHEQSVHRLSSMDDGVVIDRWQPYWLGRTAGSASRPANTTAVSGS